jgi:hypothetical protein
MCVCVCVCVNMCGASAQTQTAREVERLADELGEGHVAGGVVCCDVQCETSHVTTKCGWCGGGIKKKGNPLTVTSRD